MTQMQIATNKSLEMGLILIGILSISAGVFSWYYDILFKEFWVPVCIISGFGCLWMSESTKLIFKKYWKNEMNKLLDIALLVIGLLALFAGPFAWYTETLFWEYFMPLCIISGICCLWLSMPLIKKSIRSAQNS